MKGYIESLFLQGMARNTLAMRASAFALKQSKSYEMFEDCGNVSSFRVEDFLLLASAGRPLVRDLPNAGYDSVAPFKEHRPEYEFVFIDLFFGPHLSDTGIRLLDETLTEEPRCQDQNETPFNQSRKSNLNCHRYYTTGQLSQ